jgi:hypothetical protein
MPQNNRFETPVAAVETSFETRRATYGLEQSADKMHCQIITRRVDELRPHPLYIRHVIAVPLDKRLLSLNKAWQHFANRSLSRRTASSSTDTLAGNWREPWVGRPCHVSNTK